MMNKLRMFFRDNWLPIILYGLLFAGLGGLLFWQLGSLTNGYAPQEQTSLQASASLGELLKNPLHAPYYLVVKGLSYIWQDTLLVTRLASVAFGLATLALFGWLVRQWYGPRTTALAMLLFGTSAAFLHTARLGTPEVLMFGLFLLIACGFWIKSRSNPLVLLLAFLLVAGFLYVPGMVWLVVAGAIWQWRTLDRAFKDHLVIVSLGGLLFLAALFPLGWAFYNDTQLIRPWLGIPAELPTVMQALRNMAEVPAQLFVRHLPDPLHWLGNVGVLDVFVTTMFFLGGWRLIAGIKLVRTQIFIAIFVLSTLLIGLGGSVTLIILVPFIYLVAAGGINYMLRQWYTVFPRNPIAKALGLGLLSAVVVLAAGYHLRHYFIGWPQASATQTVFTIKPATDTEQSDTIER